MKINKYFNRYIIIIFLLVIFILIIFYFKKYNIESFRGNPFLSGGHHHHHHHSPNHISHVGRSHVGRSHVGESNDNEKCGGTSQKITINYPKHTKSHHANSSGHSTPNVSRHSTPNESVILAQNTNNNSIKDHYIIKNRFDAKSIILKDCQDNYSINAKIDPSKCYENAWVTNAAYLDSICGHDSYPLYKATVNNKVYYGCQENAPNSYQLRWKPINNQTEVDHVEVTKLQSTNLNKECIKVASRGKKENHVENHVEEENNCNNILSKASIMLKLETDTIDSGTSHINVTTVGSVNFTRIDNKNCIQFNNSLSNYLKFKFNNINKFTICFWIYIMDNQSYTAVSLNSGTFIHQDPVFQADFYNGASINNYVALPNQWTAITKSNYNYVGKWVHVAYTCNQENFKTELFINGNLNSTGSGTGKLPVHVNSFIIGRSGDNYRAFHGYIRYFCVFNFILKPCQVKDIHDCTMISGSAIVSNKNIPAPAPAPAPVHKARTHKSPISIRIKATPIKISKPNDCSYNEEKSKPTFTNECSKDELLSKANIILKLENNTTNTGNSNITVTTVGSVDFANINNKKCVHFKNSFNDYLKFKYCNTEQFTMCYLIYVIDRGGYTALSISSGNFNNIDDPVFQADFYNGTQILNFVALPNRWTMTKNDYNYVGKWTHVAYTCDQKTFKIQLFINGNLVNSASGRSKLKTHVNTYIMGRSGDTGRAFNGYIRHFYKFNFVLSPCQVKNIYEISNS